LPYRGSIFDLDGTLLDTLEDLADSMNAALTANGLPTRPNLDEHKYMVGQGVDVYLHMAMGEQAAADSRLYAKVRADYLAIYGRNWNVKTRPYEGVHELVDGLRRRGLVVAVLSNKPNETTRKTVDAFLGGDRFDLVRGALDDVQLKPDPASALAIAAELGIEPGQFIYVGDTAVDMRTARAAGMCAIGALWGFRTAAELQAAGAHVLVERPLDVLKCVE
jgi:phosphoglycolate phosphatase